MNLLRRLPGGDKIKKITQVQVSFLSRNKRENKVPGAVSFTG